MYPRKHSVRFVLKTWLVVLLIGLVAAVCSAQQPHAFTPDHTHPAFKTMQAVCTLRVGGGSGSGTLVGVRDDLALILSCRHVCRQVGNEVVVSWPLADGQQSTGIVTEIIDRNPAEELDALGRFSTDLAIVVCRRPRGVEPVPIGQFAPGEGPYVAMGWRAQLFRVAISPTAAERPDGLVLTTAPFVGGMSGGPLFQQSGRLVAVVVADVRQRNGQHMYGVSVNGEELHRLLFKYRR